MQNPLANPSGREHRLAQLRVGTESPIHFSSPVVSPRLADKVGHFASPEIRQGRLVPGSGCTSPVDLEGGHEERAATAELAAARQARARPVATALAAAKISDLAAVQLCDADVVVVRKGDSVAAAAAALWARHAPAPTPGGVSAEAPEGASPLTRPLDEGPPPPLGAVVRDDDGTALGVLDAADILELMVEGDPRLFNFDDDGEDGEEAAAAAATRHQLWEQLALTPCADVLTPQRTAARAELTPETSLLAAAVHLWRRDRLPVSQPDDAGKAKLWGVADLASIGGYLRSRAGEAAAELLGSTLQEVGLGRQGALCVSESSPVAEAISLMGVTRPPLSGVAVTAEDGRIIGHFSLPHVLRVVSDGKLLSEPLGKVAACGDRSALCTTPSAGVSDVLDALLCAESPAVYVVQDGRTDGAVSLSELMHLLVHEGHTGGECEASDDD
eukprot:TRINITY_DN51126_c0_g1_i1.p1 TRINITY_DN51126_c0_g1~~TRINITY_DN51126_c0_g1_i1.p1  ORF type:complete len:444 (+),score=113.54 TRINITY_DN51126_c0_g1_i1:69-1400(+)